MYVYVTQSDLKSDVVRAATCLYLPLVPSCCDICFVPGDRCHPNLTQFNRQSCLNLKDHVLSSSQSKWALRWQFHTLDKWKKTSRQTTLTQHVKVNMYGDSLNDFERSMLIGWRNLSRSLRFKQDFLLHRVRCGKAVITQNKTNDTKRWK